MAVLNMKKIDVAGKSLDHQYICIYVHMYVNKKYVNAKTSRVWWSSGNQVVLKWLPSGFQVVLSVVLTHALSEKIILNVHMYLGMWGALSKN